MGKNYYDVLGVPKGTSDATAIKKAYKKAALKFHPDRPGGDKQKFQEVSEAFEVLNDEKKKKAYDMFGEAGTGPGPVPGPSGGSDDPGGPFSAGGHPFESGGTSFFTTTNGSPNNGPSTGFHSTRSDPFSVFESIFGTMDVDKAMGGGGRGKRRYSHYCST